MSVASPAAERTEGRPLATVGAALAAVTSRLRDAGVPDARLSAELLLAHVLGLRRVDLLPRRDRVLAASEAAELHGLSERRAAREPVQYVVGEAGFRELLLRVGPGVLVPRPETECLVEAVLQRLRALRRTFARVLDVGTGSGAVALAILTEEPASTAVATDISDAALRWAQANAERLGVRDRLDLRRGDLLESLGDEERFDAVVANLPYVSTSEWPDLAPEVREFEPRVALLGGPTGLELVERLVRRAARHLVAGGFLACEAAPHHAAALRSLVEGTAGLRYIAVFPDLAGRARGFLAEARATPQP